MKLLSTRSAVFVLSAGLLCAAPAFAQTDAPQSAPMHDDGPPPPPDGGGPRRGGPDRRAEMLQHALNLNQDQTTQVKALLETERSKMQALRTSSSADQADHHTQMMAIHQDTDSKIRALLTTEQATRYDAMQAHMRERRQGGGDAPPPPSGGPGGL